VANQYRTAHRRQGVHIRLPEGRLGRLSTSAVIAVIVSITIVVNSELFQKPTLAISIILALIALVLASASAGLLARLSHYKRPSPSEEEAAIARIQAIVGFLLARHGIEDPVIHPGVKILNRREDAERHAGQDGEHDRGYPLRDMHSRSSEAFIANIADQPRFTVVLGRYASGKTSLMLRLTQHLLADKLQGRGDLVPLFFKSTDWSEQPGSFHKWVAAAALEYFGIPSHITDFWIRTGRLFIVFDGLDELPQERLSQFVESVASWTQAAEGTRLAISSTLGDSKTQGFISATNVDQICVIQPLSQSDIRNLLRSALSRIQFDIGPERQEAMSHWVAELTSRTEYLQGPALVGLIGEAIEESEKTPGKGALGIDNDPAYIAFQVANSFFSRGDLAPAIEAYSAIARLPHSRWHIPAYTLLGTCLYLIDEIDQANEVMLECVALRLRENIQPSPDAVKHLSDTELRCWAAVPLDSSYDVAQISSAAGLPIKRSRQALQNLRERGLVETVENTDQRARFRRSILPDAIA
jgi:hypothetical protein